MENNNASRSPEDIEKELSVGRFAAQQLRTLGFLIGGAVAGLLAGKGIGKTGLANKLAKYAKGKSPEDALSLAKTMISSFGSLVGLLAGTIASSYEHWKKVEREQLSVQEINKDVASIMDKRAQLEETLDSQHRVVRELLAKHSKAETSMGEKVRASQQAASEAEPRIH